MKTTHTHEELAARLEAALLAIIEPGSVAPPVSQIEEGETELCDGLTLRIRLERDTDMGAPWKEHDGHGPVSDWTRRDKRAGELVLCSDRSLHRFYDFAEAVRIAKRDGWGPRNPGETRGQTAHRAALADFEHLRAWCNDQWQWVSVVVSLHNAAGEELGADAVGGCCMKTLAHGMAQSLLDAHSAEQEERAEWEARGVETVGGAA